MFEDHRHHRKVEYHGRCNEHPDCRLLVMPETHGYIYWHAFDDEFVEDGTKHFPVRATVPDSLPRGTIVMIEPSEFHGERVDNWWIYEEPVNEESTETPVVSDTDEKITVVTTAFGDYLRAKISYDAAKAAWEQEHGGLLEVVVDKLASTHYHINSSLDAQVKEVFKNFSDERISEEEERQLNDLSQKQADALATYRTELHSLKVSFAKSLMDLYEGLVVADSTLRDAWFRLKEEVGEISLPWSRWSSEKPTWFNGLIQHALDFRNEGRLDELFDPSHSEAIF